MSRTQLNTVRAGLRLALGGLAFAASWVAAAAAGRAGEESAPLVPGRAASGGAPANAPAGRPVAAPRDLAAAQLADALNAARQQRGTGTLAAHAGLDAEAQAMVQEAVRLLSAQPGQVLRPDVARLQRVKTGWPSLARLSAQFLRAESLDQLCRRAADCKVSGIAGLTDLGIGVAAADRGAGQKSWLALVLGARLLPAISPQLVNQGQREFELRCFLCGYDDLVRLRLSLPHSRDTLLATCRHCKCLIDVYGVDSAGRYHRPPWFMRRFSPQPVSRPLDAWLLVLQQGRRAKAGPRSGRPAVWQTAEETHRGQSGDSKDWAILLADWLAACGYEARVVLGQVAGRAQVWVVLRSDGRDYLLETTRDGGTSLRTPPRAELMRDHVPRAQFDRDGLWFRTSTEWTGDYQDQAQWRRDPWPPERDPGAIPSQTR